MGHESRHILAALKTGSISIEEAAARIAALKTQGASVPPVRKAPDKIALKQAAGGYHRVIIERPGSIDDLKVVASQVPVLGPHEVRIAVKAFSLNFADLLCTRGLYPSMPPYPFTPGLEVSGTVAAVGEGVKAFKPGDPVVAMAGGPMGGHATQLTCPAEQVFPKPDSLSFEEACALPIVAVTMLVAFDKAKVQWGEKVLIQTATGGTGLMAVQLAKYYGAVIFATAGSEHKLAYLEQLGVPYRINYLTTDFQQEIHHLTRGEGVDVVINTLPGDAIQKGLNCLSPEGRYIELAMTGIKSAKAIDISRLTRNQTFYSIDPGRLKRPEIVRDHFMEMIRMANRGVLKATICKTFGFTDIKSAYRYLENRRNIGKIIVRVPEDIAYVERPAPVCPAVISRSGDMDARSVAIIGMSGRFAGADDLRRFWDNLARGKNSISRAPTGRWDDEAGDKDARIYWQQGGFLEDIDKFDPLFFNISPAEAEYMDPQQRLFLEEAWRALEDAGYAPKALAGRKCGVFVGAGKGDYLGGRAGSWKTANAHRLMGTAPAILAARISYLLDLTGPSIAVDTACSSSLVAIHQACQSILGGECEMALAGGVCLLTTRDLLVMAGKAGMLSPTGQCHTFDNGADGFVTGEGVGTILLKALPQAIEDGDCIHAVIRGGGFNQDGRTNGITAPSAKSQVKLEEEVYERTGINPESVSYVEAHGTGTKLGDPIEVSALSQVYGAYTHKKQYCAIGSVKTNIGHTLPAAGVASVIKVALSLDHKQIPPSINFTRENEHINFTDSPFFVNTELRDWTPCEGHPLRAAVSSFGFSGTNVHMVMDGYGEKRPAPDTGSRPAVFVLSARTPERLRAYAQEMASFLEGWEENPPYTLVDIAYTSQVGREAMAHRLAVAVNSVRELRDRLARFAAGEDAVDGLVCTTAEPRTDESRTEEPERLDTEVLDAVRAWEENGNASPLITLWVSGRDIDWQGLYKKDAPRRISLPTYPFERERYWMTDEAEQGAGKILHPLLHENTSDLTEQRFSATFTGEEFFLADHRIGGRPMLPGVAYLEMARAAVTAAAGLGAERISIKNVVWARPVTVGDAPVRVHIGLFPEEGGEIAYEVYSSPDAAPSGAGSSGGSGTEDLETVVHSSGTILVHSLDGATDAGAGPDLEGIKAGCQERKSHGDLYGTGENGEAPGSFMCIRELFINGTEALSLLELPAHLDATSGAFGLHPSVLNGAFETAIFGLHPEIRTGETVLGLFEKGAALIPYSLGEIEILHPVLPGQCYAHAVRVTDGDVFNIRVVDTSGTLLIRLNHFAARALAPAASAAARTPVRQPMIDFDLSGAGTPEFLKRFTGDEFYFTDHVVAGRKMLPGVAYLEMARAAVSLASEGNGGPAAPGVVLKNIVWTRPIVWEEGVKDPLDVHIRLFPGEKASGTGMDYEVFTRGDRRSDSDSGQDLVHSRGSAEVLPVEAVPGLDIPSIKAQCTRHRMGAKDCYAAYEKMGISYGPGHRGIQTLYVGEGQVLARLTLPEDLFDDPFTLHPGLMDSALQAAIGLMVGPDAAGVNGRVRAAVPFALERMEIFAPCAKAPCAKALWAYVRNTPGSEAKVRKLDIDVCDDTGRLCARLQGFSSKAFKDPETGTLLLNPSWKEKEADTVPRVWDRHTVVLCEADKGLVSALKKAMPGVDCLTLTSKKKDLAGRFETYAVQLFNRIKKGLDKAPKAEHLIQLVVPGDGETRLVAGLAGLLKTADMERSTLCGQTIILAGGSPESLPGILAENARCPGDREIRYRDDRRLVSSFEEFDDAGDKPVESTDPSGQSQTLPWKDRGVYLITGGAGGLGAIFAKEIAGRVEAPVIILAGRSKPGQKQEALLATLEETGAVAEYRQADAVKKADVRRLVSDIVNSFGELNGVIHSAGIIRDNTIVKKTDREFKAVLGPKVAGTANLDEATGNLPLDFFILFSSAAGALGNIGQADYACANAFMDAYAEYRAGRVRAEKRSGRTLSLNWPLWREGGMAVDEETVKLAETSFGITALETGEGLSAFYHALALDQHRILVTPGRGAKIRETLLGAAPDPAKSPSPVTPESASAGLAGTMIQWLKGQISAMMKIGKEKIDPREELGSYGFDSITLTELTNKVNREYGLDLPPTLFFEYPNLEGFAAYLAEAYPSVLTAKSAETPGPEPTAAPGAPRSGRHRRRFARAAAGREADLGFPVAIVGISGKFPMAGDVEAFWQNLEAGKNCITEIPKDRWDWRRCLEDGQGGEAAGIKWGGFIDGVSDFDPMFFSISPREAELMDPQQRLMMLYVWKAMEDAGISPKTMSQKATGVFVSPGINEYMHLPSFPKHDPYAPTGLAISGIPNRISYAFNLHGPSEYCETACSSALVALHRGIVSLRLGECEQAVIGAVNLLLSPDGFLGVNAYGHLSPSGRPKSFQADADGYVRSEGVGAMIVKPLDRAVEEKDRIYAVIRGTGIAHGGRGMSLTAPTGRGMKAAMVQAYEQAGVSPDTISYIEAHGTATPMGDAVEINTLRSGYEEISEKSPDGRSRLEGASGPGPGLPPGPRPVYISSLKPCIGHGEIVSGMAALIKVVMALKHKTIPGLPGFKTMNENISLGGSRFEFSADPRPWEAQADAKGNPLPRRAAINSYGFSGVNAHAVVEEYVGKMAVAGDPATDARGDSTVIFVLSARNRDRLRAYAGTMAKFLEENDDRLEDIAYTLQTGREAMAYRLAVVVTDKDGLIEGLKAFAGAGSVSDGPVKIYTGQPQTGPEADPESGPAQPGDSSADLLAEKDPGKLAGYWAGGGDLSWEDLYGSDHPPGRISLPGYPFDLRRCWIEGLGNEEGPVVQGIKETAVSPGPDVREWLVQTLCGMLKLTEAEIRPDQDMGQFGFDSYSGVRLINRIEDAYGLRIPLEQLIEYSTVETLARYLEETVAGEGDGGSGTAADDETAGSAEEKADAQGVGGGQGLDLDDLSEAELDLLLKQHISDE